MGEQDTRATYRAYLRGEASFDDVARAAERTLAQFATDAERGERPERRAEPTTE